jgi:hypothetical protein
MKEFFGLIRTTTFAVTLFLAFVSTTALSQNQRESDVVPAMEESLKLFLQKFDDGKRTRYVAAFHDLNDDGMPEAIVYLVGNEWCGSGGCNTLILARDATSWKIVTNITITSPPIRILANKSNGWHSIGVWVQGGGIQPGYEAELRFDGQTYPRNPSTPPARRVEGEPAGETVILLGTRRSTSLRWERSDETEARQSALAEDGKAVKH